MAADVLNVTAPALVERNKANFTMNCQFVAVIELYSRTQHTRRLSIHRWYEKLNLYLRVKLVLWRENLRSRQVSPSSFKLEFWIRNEFFFKKMRAFLKFLNLSIRRRFRFVGSRRHRHTTFNVLFHFTIRFLSLRNRNSILIYCYCN